MPLSSMRLLILSALFREISGVLRVLDGRAPLRGLAFRARQARHPLHGLTFVETGMGLDNAARVFEAAAEISKPEAVISLGYCGALLPGVSVGDLVWASTVCLIDVPITEALSLPGRDRVFERMSASVPIRRGTFLTLAQWMTKAEIQPHIPIGAPLPVCDMETYAIAKLALERDLPFFAIRAVSDGFSDEVGFDPSAVCDASGAFRLSRSLLFFGSRPRLMTRAIRLARGSANASRSLSRATEVLLQML